MDDAYLTSEVRSNSFECIRQSDACMLPAHHHCMCVRVRVCVSIEREGGRQSESENGQATNRMKDRERALGQQYTCATDTNSAKNTLIRLCIIGAGRHARATRAVAIWRTLTACSSCSPLPQVSPCVKVEVRSVAFKCDRFRLSLIGGNAKRARLQSCLC